jgi:alpha-ribazole phosphatase
MDIVLIRHPAPAIAEGVCYGSLDVPVLQPPWPLAEHIEQTLQAMVKDGVVRGRPSKWLSSPAQRCTWLADRLAQRTVAHEPALRELNFGCWEGQEWDRIPRHELDAWAKDLMGFREHGGESAEDMQSRLIQWRDALHTESESNRNAVLAVVTHAGVIRQLAALWLNLPLADVLQWPLQFGAVSAFRLAGDHAVRRIWNCSSL